MTAAPRPEPTPGDDTGARASAPHPSTALPAIAMLGVGNMSGAILAGITRPGFGPAAPVRATTRSAASAVALAGDRVEAVAAESLATANADAARGAGLVVLGVKPYAIGELLDEIRDALDPGAVVVSVAAGVECAAIERRLAPGTRVVRAMPNTPATLGLGVTGIAPGAHADADAMRQAAALFSAVGDVVEVDESQIALVGGISGSGPAYLYYLVEALMRSAEGLGLDAERARTLAVGTVRGASEMLAHHPDLDPAELRRRVTSPNGTTERAIAVFAEAELPGTVDRAVRANIARSIELAAENA